MSDDEMQLVLVLSVAICGLDDEGEKCSFAVMYTSHQEQYIERGQNAILYHLFSQNRNWGFLFLEQNFVELHVKCWTESANDMKFLKQE